MEIVILAAGKGTRMRSDYPKVLHTIGGKPMLEHVIATAYSLTPTQIHVVVGHGGDKIREAFSDLDCEKINWVVQHEQLGTGHAMQQVLPHISSTSEGNQILVLFGDVPLVKTQTLLQLVTSCKPPSLALLTARPANPRGFGRIIRNKADKVVSIIEERDANAEQRQINEVNTGIMAIPVVHLIQWLKALKNYNNQREFYLTDIVAMAATEQCPINALTITDEIQVMGVNDKHQLASVERHFQLRQVETLLESGVILRDPARLDIRGEVICGKDTVIDCNVVLEGKVSLGNTVEIGANCIIKDAVIGDGSKVLPGTHIEGSTIGNKASVGPMARLRPGTKLGDETKIGNFVETKNAEIGKGTKANHLAYLGDVKIGENCNLGAGVIVCNYDGANKHKTIIGNNVFVGSNSVLVAPVELKDNAFVAAGSTINTQVPADHLAVARSKQRNIAGWKRPIKKQ